MSSKKFNFVQHFFDVKEEEHELTGQPEGRYYMIFETEVYSKYFETKEEAEKMRDEIKKKIEELLPPTKSTQIL